MKMHIPENRCRCENLQSEAKWSLAGSLYGNGLEFHSQPKPLSRALLGVADTEQTGWRILPKRSSLPALYEIRIVGSGDQHL
ncbi:hypothetical protein NXX51_14010 [Bacteroides thetaiotaomicron]|uniref:hypothetical protein n=2 Tax=Bacteroides TaxID=816 RepID=UPI0021645147|nr:hypothetical protein [Bacteroides thetaiotaomicron]UVS11089.1 hypothetical protein NXX51_14010 [Bacteroides thetaiotaomicron]